MPGTAWNHFADDIGRAKAIQQAAATTADATLQADLARASVAFGVGALDAYLCDVFVDSLARAMRHCRQESVELPAGYARLSLPIGPLLSPYGARPNWGLRMAARAHMEKNNMLQVGRVVDLLNPVLPPGRKLWISLVPQYLSVGRKRLTGMNAAEYATSRVPKSKRDKAVVAALLKRIGGIVQRRHDIAHNCDRPRSAPQPMIPGTAKSMLVDIESFVLVLDKHLGDHRIY